MKAVDFKRACDIAFSDQDLSGVNFNSLTGFGTKGFQPVTVPIESVARCIRWQAQQFNGQVDDEALNECHYFFVKCRRVEVIDAGAKQAAEHAETLDALIDGEYDDLGKMLTPIRDFLLEIAK